MTTSNDTVPSVQASASGLRFEDFQVAEVHLTTGSLAHTEDRNYNIDFTLGGRLSRSQGRFILLLGVRITTASGLFDANLQVRGLFSFDTEMDSNKLDKLLTLNTPALVFPYVRAYLGALTALSGLPTVLAPTLNTSGLAESLRQAIEEVESV